MRACKCPNCGAPVKMDDYGEFWECPYCGSQFIPEPLQADASLQGNISESTETDFDDTQIYFEIVNRHLSEFTVSRFIEKFTGLFSGIINALADHGMLIQIGIVSAFILFAIVGFFM